MSPNPERIAEIRAAEQAATPGPWKFLPDLEDEDTGELVAHIGHPSHGNYVYIGLDMCVSDADFCILVRTAVPELLAEVEWLQREVGRLQRDLPAATEVIRLQDSEEKLLAEVERLQAQLELAHEVANDLEWALSRLKQRRRTVFVRQTMLEATERLRAFREASREH